MSILNEVKDAYKLAKVQNKIKIITEKSNELNAMTKPVELAEFPNKLRILKESMVILGDIVVELKAEDLKPLMEDRYKAAIDNWEKEDFEINEKFENKLNAKVQQLEDDARETNKKKVFEFNEANKIYIELENKRKELEVYSDEIVDICEANGITTSDVDIDNSSFTVNELSDIYDQYLNFIRKKANKINLISVYRSKVPNIFMQVGILCTLLVTLIVVKPLFDIGAFLLLFVIIKKQAVSKDVIKSFIVLYGLVFNVHPLEMGFKGEIPEEELVGEKINEDEDERLQTVADEWASELKEHDQLNPEKKLDEERILLASKLSGIQKEFDDTVKSIIETRDTVLELYMRTFDEWSAAFEDAKSKVQLLGKRVSKSVVLSTKYALGLRDGVMEEFVDCGLRNIIVNPSRDFDKHKQFLQILFANIMTNVAPNSISAVICDPNRQGQELVGFYNPDIEDIISFTEDSIENVLKKLKQFADNNLKAMRGKSITEFNKEAEETGRTPREYKLLVCLSQPKRIEEDEALVEFMRYSAELGVIVLLVSEKRLPGTVVYREPFENIPHPYEIDTNVFGMEVSNMLQEAIKKSSSGGLLWKDFLSRTTTDEEIWTYKGDNEIEIRPGFYEGDPTQYKGYTFGNTGNVHMIGVGGTGAGKSVFLNFVVCELTRRYSPRDLELWMIDFKGNEFVKYLPKVGHPNMLPHMKACLCTSDGDYAGSLFGALRKVCEDRFEKFKKMNFKNMLQYNSKIRADAELARTDVEREEILNKLMPRILCINDEFQVIFEKGEAKVVDQINKDITFIAKLGRACGVHLFFTSQSMNNTMKADTLDQFTLRFALKCGESVSMQVLGTKFASEIKQRNGYLYVRSGDDKSLQSQKRYRTPFLCDEPPNEKNPNRVDELQEHIDMMAERAKVMNLPVKDVITYEESTIHPIEELDTVYEKLSTSSSSVENLFLLGNRMTYSSNKAPENIMLTPVNNSHIFAIFQEQVDFFNFFKTIMRNISKQPDADVLINSQVVDLHYICEVDKHVEGAKALLSNEKMSAQYLYKNVYNKILQERIAGNVKDKPLYIILLGWDKANGVGIDRDATLTGDITTFLQIAGEFNIHVIFICSSLGKIPGSLVEACSYKIAGKVSETDSFAILNNTQASKGYDMKNGYMFLNRKGVITRAKIYQSKIEREIKATELVV